MKKVFELATKHALPIQASLERYMKCGIGICGSCCINEWLVCCDGTIFGSKDLSKMDEFGKVSTLGSVVTITPFWPAAFWGPAAVLAVVTIVMWSNLRNRPEVQDRARLEPDRTVAQRNAR